MLGNSGASIPSDLRAHDLLAAFLLSCKIVGAGLDFYRPYLDSLPETYPVPFYCTEEEALCLPRYLWL